MKYIFPVLLCLNTFVACSSKESAENNQAVKDSISSKLSLSDNLKDALQFKKIAASPHEMNILKSEDGFIAVEEKRSNGTKYYEMKQDNDLYMLNVYDEYPLLSDSAKSYIFDSYLFLLKKDKDGWKDISSENLDKFADQKRVHFDQNEKKAYAISYRVANDGKGIYGDTLEVLFWNKEKTDIKKK